ncbi:hypothetical protein, partial [Klebsiella pneumoniae]|uniref:hypothetical protein n=1 Tax=Klebsiella pneumoniae TaxID=573 RepID=UPI003531D356
ENQYIIKRCESIVYIFQNACVLLGVKVSLTCVEELQKKTLINKKEMSARRVNEKILPKYFECSM